MVARRYDIQFSSHVQLDISLLRCGHRVEHSKRNSTAPRAYILFSIDQSTVSFKQSQMGLSLATVYARKRQRAINLNQSGDAMSSTL